MIGDIVETIADAEGLRSLRTQSGSGGHNLPTDPQYRFSSSVKAGSSDSG